MEIVAHTAVACHAFEIAPFFQVQQDLQHFFVFGAVNAALGRNLFVMLPECIQGFVNDADIPRFCQEAPEQIITCRSIVQYFIDAFPGGSTRPFGNSPLRSRYTLTPGRSRAWNLGNELSMILVT